MLKLGELGEVSFGIYKSKKTQFDWILSSFKIFRFAPARKISHFFAKQKVNKQCFKVQNNGENGTWHVLHLNDFKRPLKVVQLLCRKKGRRAFSRQINDSRPCSTGFSNLVKNVII